MLKRVRWVTTGVALGVGATVWAELKMKSLAERYRPAGIAQDAAGRAALALRDGRTTMREREAQLRAKSLVSARNGRTAARP